MSAGTLGIVMLVHGDLSRSAQVIRHWAKAGCAVVVHVDSAVPLAAYTGFTDGLDDLLQANFHGGTDVNGALG